MKILHYIIAISIIFLSCSKDEESKNDINLRKISGKWEYLGSTNVVFEVQPKYGGGKAEGMDSDGTLIISQQGKVIRASFGYQWQSATDFTIATDFGQFPYLLEILDSDHILLKDGYVYDSPEYKGILPEGKYRKTD